MAEGSIQAEVVRKTRAKKAPVATGADLAKIAISEAFAKETLETVVGWEISSQEEMNDAGELLAAVVFTKKELAEDLKALTGPLSIEEKKHRNAFKPAQQLCEKGEQILKEVMRQFELKRMRQQDAALKLVADSGGTADVKTLMVAHGVGAIASPTQVSPRDVWRWKEVDLTQVPEHYFIKTLNTKMIDAEVKELKQSFNVPGLEAYRDVQIVNKAQRSGE